MNTTFHTQLIKKKALELGFSFCGVSKADFLQEEARQFDDWLKNGFHGKMQYMENHYDKRLDPRLLVDDAKSIVSLMLNYFPEEVQQDETAPKISKYAYGTDYHFIIKDKLKSLFQFHTGRNWRSWRKGFCGFSPCYGQGMGQKKWSWMDGEECEYYSPQARFILFYR